MRILLTGVTDTTRRTIREVKPELIAKMTHKAKVQSERARIATLQS